MSTTIIARSVDDYLAGVQADKVLLDASGFAHDSYGLTETEPLTRYFLIRPELMIGALGTSPKIVDQYFSNILRLKD